MNCFSIFEATHLLQLSQNFCLQFHVVPTTSTHSVSVVCICAYTCSKKRLSFLIVIYSSQGLMDNLFFARSRGPKVQTMDILLDPTTYFSSQKCPIKFHMVLSITDIDCIIKEFFSSSVKFYTLRYPSKYVQTMNRVFCDQLFYLP